MNKPIKLYNCPTCGKQFRKPYRLKNHVNSDHLHLPYIHCSVCNFRSKNAECLDRHMKRMHQCPTCHVTFSSDKDRLEHLKIHSSSSKQQIICQVCQKPKGSKKDLRVHMYTHTGEKPLECQLCFKRFRASSGLFRHLKAHTGEKPFKCAFPNCSKAYSEASDLKKHERVHTNETPFECVFCSKKCKFGGALTSHYLGHIGERPFSCKICGHEVRSSSHLKVHLKRHSGDKPFKCSLCEKAFSLRHVRNQHEKAKCQVVRNISCVFCGSTYSSRYHYFSHLRTHIGEKPFSCSICDKAFGFKGNMDCHITRVHTAEKAYKCKVCMYCTSSWQTLSHHVKQNHS